MYNQGQRQPVMGETQAVQEGFGAEYGQAHLDPTDLDGLQSFATVNIAVDQGNQAQPLIQQPTPEDQGHTYAMRSPITANQVSRIPFESSYTPRLQHNHGPYAQSVSGFSDYGMNVPAGDHLQQLPSDIEYQVIQEGQRNVNLRQQDLQLGTEAHQARAELQNGSLHPQEELQEVATRPFETASGPQNGPNSATDGSLSEASTGIYHTADSPSAVSPAQYPQHSDIRSRQQTFHNWPMSSPMTPESLVKAGFFYAGKNDHCLCYHCGLRLRDWEQGDDAMREHARWSSNCPLVRQERTSGTAVKTYRQNGSELVKKPSVSDKEKQFVAMGFHVNDVRKALQKVGSDDSQIVDYLLRMQQQNSNPELPPEMDPRRCKVCMRRSANVALHYCGHIVCESCSTKRSRDGMFRCGICDERVVRTVAVDRNAC